MVEFHLVAGLASLLAGFVALYSPKGGCLHRRSGLVFVCAMSAMLGSAALLALPVEEKRGIALGAFLTLYLIVTSLLTVTRRVEQTRGLTAGLALFAIGLGLAAIVTGNLLLVPIALACAAADFRLLARGTIAGTRRLVRHLWRMTIALWVATASFFLGQADLFPAERRNFAVLSIPVVAVLLALLYWLGRLAISRKRAVLAAQGVEP